MKRRAFSLLLVSIAARAVIVDRVAITVGNKVITESAIELRVRLTAFENGDRPDFSLAGRKIAAQRLIDQKLVEREMDVGNYPRLADDDRAELLNRFAQTNFNSDRAALVRALEGYRVTETDLEDDLARQSDLLSFLNVRFRPAVDSSDRADAEMESWLKDKRRQTRIQYLEKDLSP
jgi:hypothetical protein